MSSKYKQLINKKNKLEIIVETLYINCFDNNIKNIIITAVFKYLYINIIEIKINLSLQKINLSYQLNLDDLNISINILKNSNHDLILVKNRYISDISIYIYYNKYINKYFNINIKISTLQVESVNEISSLLIIN